MFDIFEGFPNSPYAYVREILFEVSPFSLLISPGEQCLCRNETNKSRANNMAWTSVCLHVYIYSGKCICGFLGVNVISLLASLRIKILPRATQLGGSSEVGGGCLESPNIHRKSERYI